MSGCRSISGFPASVFGCGMIFPRTRVDLTWIVAVSVLQYDIRWQVSCWYFVYEACMAKASPIRSPVAASRTINDLRVGSASAIAASICSGVTISARVSVLLTIGKSMKSWFHFRGFISLPLESVSDAMTAAATLKIWLIVEADKFFLDRAAIKSRMQPFSIKWVEI